MRQQALLADVGPTLRARGRTSAVLPLGEPEANVLPLARGVVEAALVLPGVLALVLAIVLASFLLPGEAGKARAKLNGPKLLNGFLGSMKRDTWARGQSDRGRCVRCDLRMWRAV